MLETREQWLEAAAAKLRALLPPDLPPLKLSFGWPKGGRKLIGQCFSKTVSTDGATFHIFIAPKVVERVEMLRTLLHEMIHASVGTEAGHRGEFVKLGRRVGFLPPWTLTPTSAELRVKLDALADELGEIPHVGMDLKRKTQTTRLKLWVCGCGVKIRRAGDLHARCLDCGTDFARRE